MFATLSMIIGLTTTIMAHHPVDLGLGAPPTSIGGYNLVSFPTDTRPLFSMVSDVPTPFFNTDITLSSPASHRKVGSGWATWTTHNYTGDLYFYSGQELTVSLPHDTCAFVMYFEPNIIGTFYFKVTYVNGQSLDVTYDHTSFATDVRAFGFYKHDSYGTVTSIKIKDMAGTAGGFAVGEFLMNRCPPKTPKCFKIGTTLIGKDLDFFRCAHYTENYADGRQIVDGKVVIRGVSTGGEHELELYTGNLMSVPGDDCCPPDTYVTNVKCVDVYNNPGKCCRTDTDVKVWDLPRSPDFGNPDFISCLHDIVHYQSYIPLQGNASWSMSPADLDQNNQVEVYASLHPTGCCDCYLYSLECPYCSE